MKFKSKRHLILSMKKKSGVELSDAEIKELLGIEGVEEKKPEDKPKEEPKKDPAADAPAADADPKKDPKEEEKKDATDPAAAPMSVEDLGKAIATLTENVNMIMEALASMMDQEGSEDSEPAPTEESKEDPKKDEPKKEGEVADEEEEKELTEDEMEKELMKTIEELEGLV